MAKKISFTELILPKEKTVAFSGYRASKFSSYFSHYHNEMINHIIRHRLDVVIRYLYHELGYTHFIQGMQSGLDLNAGMSVGEIKGNGYKDFRLYGAVPFEDFLPENHYANIYNHVAENCEQIYYVGNSPRGEFHLRRNDFMLTNSSVLVCYYDGARRSGTEYTYNRAKQFGMPIYNLCNTPKGLEYGDYHPTDFTEIIFDMSSYITPANLLVKYLTDDTI